MTVSAAVMVGCLAVLQATSAAPGKGGDYAGSIRRAADQILLHQGADGSLCMVPAAGAANSVISYFANFAGMGLADAYRVTRDRRCLDAAKRWANWYESHLNADDTIYDYGGRPGEWKSTGKYDSTDSYASTYMELVLAIDRAKPDAAWLRDRAPFLRRTLAAVRLTLQPNGLTKAHPTWDFMYTMDNVEVAKGLRALAVLARTLRDRPLEAEAAKMARDTTSAVVRDLWDPTRRCYRIGVMTNGAKAEGLEKWYPDVMANLMAVAWLPPSVRNRELFGRLKERFGKDLPATVASEDDAGRLLWWAWAAMGAGDTEMAGQLAATLSRFDESVRTYRNVADLGHICRILAAMHDAGRSPR